MTAGETPPTLRMVWPTLHPDARYGLAGDIVEAIEPHSEADPAALLVTFLAAFGALVGAGPHAMADGARHGTRLWTLIVGATAQARKGSSWQQIRRILVAADNDFVDSRILAGFGSGEALVDAIAKSDDHRLLVHEPEFARVLAVGRRDGSTVGPILRQAWDGDRLQIRSRAGITVADEAHVTVVGHITRDELLAKLADSDTLGGTVNRFLIVGARRSKLLPEGGNLDDRTVTDFGRKVASVAMQARPAGLVTRTPSARDYWDHVYRNLAADDPGGVLGAVVARNAAQVLRLSVTFALLDSTRSIDIPHIRAAQAVWDYSRASATAIFGERTGDPTADLILSELQKAGSEGLTGTAVRDLLGRHARKERIDLATSVLIEKGLATKATENTTRGRPRTVLRLATKATDATEETDATGDAPPLDDATLARWMAAADAEEAAR